jgi:hypothetical protein
MSDRKTSKLLKDIIKDIIKDTTIGFCGVAGHALGVIVSLGSGLGVPVAAVVGVGGAIAGLYVGILAVNKFEKFTSRVPAKAAAANSQEHSPCVTGSNLDYTTRSPAPDSSPSNSFRDAVSLRINQGTQITENTAERTRPEVKQQPHQPRNTR